MLFFFCFFLLCFSLHSCSDSVTNRSLFCNSEALAESFYSIFTLSFTYLTLQRTMIPSLHLPHERRGKHSIPFTPRPLSTSGPAAAAHWPLTCCSRLRITATAWCSTSSLVCGFSLFRCSWHMWPSSLKASLISRTRRRSRALLAILLSRSRSAFCSGLKSSSSWILQQKVHVKLV